MCLEKDLNPFRSIIFALIIWPSAQKAAGQFEVQPGKISALCQQHDKAVYRQRPCNC